MLNKIKINSDTIYFVGDVHGFVDLISMKICDFIIRDSVFIQAGDFGCGLMSEEKRKLNNFNDILVETNNHFFVVRGNHDNPEYFKVDSKENKEYSNITFVEDYSILCVTNNENKEINILCVGGATSIDRLKNTEFIDYWKNEVFVFDQEKINELDSYVNCLVTHSIPSFCYPQTLYGAVYNYIAVDEKLEDDLKNERLKFNELYSAIKTKRLKFWFYGHYHQSNIEEIDGVKFRLLGINEIYGLTNF